MPQQQSRYLGFVGRAVAFWHSLGNYNTKAKEMELTAIPRFDRGKPFYPLVMMYYAQIFGLKQLVAKGMFKDGFGIEWPPPLSKAEIAEIIKGRYRTTEEVEAEAEVWKTAESISKLIGPIESRSPSTNDYVTVEIEDISRELFQNSKYLFSYIPEATGNLLILAHEMCKDKPYHDDGPLWEFLRHCRNAAAHGGKFTFRKEEPKRPARWRQFEITKPLEGTPLFKDENGVGLLTPGDLIWLLWDIEQAYPNMKA